MKKSLLLLSTVLSLSFLCSCNNGSNHVHAFNKQVMNEKTLAHDADCVNPKEYFYSCECGEISSVNTFFNGSPLGHKYISPTLQHGFVCSRCLEELGEPLKYKVVGDPLTLNEEDFYKMVGNDKIKIVVGLQFTSFSLKKYIFEYMSLDLKNNPIKLSACLTVPFDEDQPFFDGLIVDSHPTLTDLNEAPTKHWDQYLVNCAARKAVLQCDLVGFGAQDDKISDYHCSHLSNRNTVDGILAMFELVKEVFAKDPLKLPLFNMGYSQGGYGSLSLLRYMETEATEYEKSMIKITKTFSGSGAYNIQVMFDDSLSNPTFQYSEYIIKGLLTTHEYHPEFYGDVKVEDYLTDYGKEFLPSLINKNKDALFEVKNKKDSDGNPMYQGPGSVFNPEYFDKSSKLNRCVAAVASIENLLDGEWLPKGELFMFYSNGDTMVTPRCSKLAEELFKDLPNVEFEALDDIDHRPAGTDFYTHTVIELLLSY